MPHRAWSRPTNGCRMVVVTAVPGRPLGDGVLRTPEEERAVFVRIGALAAAVHGSTPPRTPSAGEGQPAVRRLDRHLDGARAHLGPGDEEFVRALAARSAGLPALDLVPTHGDFQLRNLLWSGRLRRDRLRAQRAATGSPGPRTALRRLDR